MHNSQDWWNHLRQKQHLIASPLADLTKRKLPLLQVSIIKHGRSKNFAACISCRIWSSRPMWSHDSALYCGFRVDFRHWSPALQSLRLPPSSPLLVLAGGWDLPFAQEPCEGEPEPNAFLPLCWDAVELNTWARTHQASTSIPLLHTHEHVPAKFSFSFFFFFFWSTERNLVLQFVWLPQFKHSHADDHILKPFNLNE